MLISLDIMHIPYLLYGLSFDYISLFYPRYIFNIQKMMLVVNSGSLSILLLLFTLLVDMCFKRHSIDGIDVSVFITSRIICIVCLYFV